MGLVQRNVTEMLRPPRRANKEMVVLTEEQAAHFLANVKGDRFEALHVLALTTGMREGELLGLRWQDIDLDNATAYVRMNEQEAERGFILPRPRPPIHVAASDSRSLASPLCGSVRPAKMPNVKRWGRHGTHRSTSYSRMSSEGS